MSDGNFNRSLLPGNSYASGVRAGRSAALSRAMNLLQEMLSDPALSLDEEGRARFLRSFHEHMASWP